MPTALALQAGLRAPVRTQAYHKVSSRSSHRPLARPVLASARPPTDEDKKSLHEQLAVPAAAVMAAALFFAATPDEALAARSGGRVGGSSGFSQRRSAPSAPRSYGGGPSINVYPTPPVVGGYGFGLPMFGG